MSSAPSLLHSEDTLIPVDDAVLALLVVKGSDTLRTLSFSTSVVAVLLAEVDRDSCRRDRSLLTSEAARSCTLCVVITSGCVEKVVVKGDTVPLLLTCCCGGAATAAGMVPPITLWLSARLCPAALAGRCEYCDLDLECPICDCARDMPGRVVVLDANPGLGSPRCDPGPCVDENEVEVFGPACAILLTSPLTCRIVLGAGAFLLESGCPARSASVVRGAFDCDSKTCCVVNASIPIISSSLLSVDSRPEALCLSVGIAGGAIDLALWSLALISCNPADGICTFVGSLSRELDMFCLRRLLLESDTKNTTRRRA